MGISFEMGMKRGCKLCTEWTDQDSNVRLCTGFAKKRELPSYGMIKVWKTSDFRLVEKSVYSQSIGK